MTIEGCSTTVAALARSPLAKFVSVTVKGHVDTCSEIIQQLALKTPPSFSTGKMSGMVQAFIYRLQWLCFPAVGFATRILWRASAEGEVG